MRHFLSKMLVTLLLLGGLVQGVGFAESKVSQYADPEYSYGSVKKVAMMPIITSFKTEDPYMVENAKVIIKEEFSKFPFEVIWLDKAITKEDALAAVNSGEYQAVVKIQVKSMGWQSQVIPGHYESYWDPVMVGGWGDGWWGGWGTVGVSEVEYVPPTVQSDANVSVAFSLFDLEKRKMVWGFSEDRDDDGGAFSSPSPEKSLKTVIKEARKSLLNAVEK